MRCDGTRKSRSRNHRSSQARFSYVLVLAMGLSAASAEGQVFNSGSNGADGALSFSCPAPPCDVVFDPVALGLDLDDDNVFHFTTITIPAGLTLHLRAVELNWAPVFWLASGAVQIDGTIDLSGEPGHGLLFRTRSIPGPGGFHGGIGARGGASATPGFGPGAGAVNGVLCNGDGAGYGTRGVRGSGQSSGGVTYGNVFLLPLIGGSGGAGGACIDSRGGGAGGGALLIASSESITIDGGISADGGEAATLNAGTTTGNGGGGSGGAIRLLAPIIGGAGSLSTAGGSTASTAVSTGGLGRIRLEAFEHNFSGTVTALSRTMTLSPNAVFLPDGLASVRVVSVDGVPAPARPTASFVNTDFTINEPSTVILTVEARNVPLGTVVTLFVYPEALADIEVQTTPLTGIPALSTAEATVTFPHGFSRFTVRALWTPTP